MSNAWGTTYEDEARYAAERGTAACDLVLSDASLGTDESRELAVRMARSAWRCANRALDARSPRLRGIISSLFVPEYGNGDPIDKMLGAVGTITSESGRLFVFTSGHFYRDTSRPTQAAPCTFEVVGGTYATAISTVQL